MLDVAGKTPIEDLISLAPEPAQVVSIANFSAAAAGARVTGGSADSQPMKALAEAAELLEQSKLVFKSETFPLERAAEAYAKFETGPRPRQARPAALTLAPISAVHAARGRDAARRTAACRSRPERRSVRARSASTCTCRSARPGAATATSTPTPPTSSAPRPDPARPDYVDAAIAELDLAARVLGPAAPPVSTVFVGGGTPTLLPPGDLGRLLHAIEERFGLDPDAEVTTESNPESVTAADLAELREQGFTRISFGMQSAVPHVLAVLDRVHSPDRPLQAVAEARAAGFADISLDLIYGTPGESLADWEASLDAAIAAEPEHLSAYALIVEEGTRLAARIRRGELPMPDDDDLADKYLLADERLTAAGFNAYEVSNWAAGRRHRCRHNLGYWRGDHWWGIGPGAHSHVGGVRWWNVKHPTAYAERLGAGTSPAYAREVLTTEQRRMERVLLELRLADGLDRGVLTTTERQRVPDLVARGLLEQHADALVLTRSGRLLADGVIRDLLDYAGRIAQGRGAHGLADPAHVGRRAPAALDGEQ